MLYTYIRDVNYIIGLLVRRVREGVDREEEGDGRIDRRWKEKKKKG